MKKFILLVCMSIIINTYGGIAEQQPATHAARLLLASMDTYQYKVQQFNTAYNDTIFYSWTALTALALLRNRNLSATNIAGSLIFGCLSGYIASWILWPVRPCIRGMIVTSLYRSHVTTAANLLAINVSKADITDLQQAQNFLSNNSYRGWLAEQRTRGLALISHQIQASQQPIQPQPSAPPLDPTPPYNPYAYHSSDASHQATLYPHLNGQPLY